MQVILAVDVPPPPPHGARDCNVPWAPELEKHKLDVGSVFPCKDCGRYWRLTYLSSYGEAYYEEVRLVPANQYAAYEPEHFEPVRRRFGRKVRRSVP